MKHRLMAVTPLRGRGHQTFSERGASAVEYGLLITGIAAIIVIAVYAFGGGVGTLFDGTCDRVMTEAQAATC